MGADEQRFRVQLEVGLSGESSQNELLKQQISEVGLEWWAGQAETTARVLLRFPTSGIVFIHSINPACL